MFFVVAIVLLVSALVAMSILPPLLGIRVASPLVALMSLTLEVILLLHLFG